MKTALWSLTASFLQQKQMEVEPALRLPHCLSVFRHGSLPHLYMDAHSRWQNFVHLHSVKVICIFPNRFNFRLLFPQYFPEPCSWDPMYSQRSPSSNCSLSQNIKWCVVYKHNGHNLLSKARISLLFHCLLFLLQKGATVSTFLHITGLFVTKHRLHRLVKKTAGLETF